MSARRTRATGLPLGPLVLVLAAAVAAAIWLAPWSDGQVAATTQRLPERYLALSLSDEAAARAKCSSPDRTVTFEVSVRNRLGRGEDLGWTARTRADDGRTSDAEQGTVTVADGRSSSFDVTVPVPSDGRYTATVSLDGRPEHVALRCRGADS